MGRLVAYGSAAADTGETVAVGLPRSRTTTTMTATITTAQAAMMRGSQFRSRAVLGDISSGPSLTSGFYTRYLRNKSSIEFGHTIYGSTASSPMNYPRAS